MANLNAEAEQNALMLTSCRLDCASISGRAEPEIQPERDRELVVLGVFFPVGQL